MLLQNWSRKNSLEKKTKGVNIMGLDSLSTLGQAFYDSVVGVLNLLVLVFFIRLVVSLFANIGQGIASTRDQVKGKAGTATASFNLSEENPSPTDDSQELIYDEVCGRQIPRQNSYIVATDNGYHYFCSWDCRQKFVESLRQSESGSRA